MTSPSEFSVVESDDDLASVIVNLKTVNVRSSSGLGDRDPNEADTRLLLESGVRALGDRFLRYKDTPDAQAFTNANDVLGAIPLGAVMAHFQRLLKESGGDPGMANRDRITKRWGTAVRYQRDLLRYVFRTYPDQKRVQQVKEHIPEMLRLRFGELVGLLCREELESIRATEVLGLRLALQAAFPNDPQLQELSRQVYDFQIGQWASIYEHISAAYNITLANEKDDFRDIAHMLNLVIEGSWIRGFDHPSLFILSDQSHITVRMVQMIMSQLAGIPWPDLATRTVRTSV